MKTELIPFGKYKGQPVEVLQNDPQYTEWLLSQPWLIERYQSIQTVIVNNFSEPSCTPEHNAMQSRFLDQSFCFNVGEQISSRCIGEKSILEFIKVREDIDWELWFLEDGVSSSIDMRFESGGWDVVIDCNITKREKWGEYDKEFTGALVFGCSWNFHIELKPTLGEEFPEVLRQVKSRKQFPANVITDEIICKSVSSENIKEMFRRSGVLLLETSEIPKHELPECFKS